MLSSVHHGVAVNNGQMFGKCGSIADAWNVFDGLYQREAVEWTAMLLAFAECNHKEKVLHQYELMREEGVSFVCAPQACSMVAEREEEVVLDGQSVKTKSLNTGRAIHADSRRMGFGTDSVGSILITIYGRCGSILDAQNVSDGLFRQNLGVWTAMLTAYAQHEHAEKALQFYEQLQKNGMFHDITVFSGSLGTCREIHHSLVFTRKKVTKVLASSLIHTYGRCGSMADAQTAFEGLVQTDEASWTAPMAGYTRLGNCAASLRGYEDMKLAGLQPNAVTFLSLVSACSHAGLGDKGVEYFESMIKDHGIPAAIEHYATTVDLRGRAGRLDKAETLSSALPMQSDLATWSSLLEACWKVGSTGASIRCCCSL